MAELRSFECFNLQHGTKSPAIHSAWACNVALSMCMMLMLNMRLQDFSDEASKSSTADEHDEHVLSHAQLGGTQDRSFLAHGPQGAEMTNVYCTCCTKLLQQPM